MEIRCECGANLAQEYVLTNPTIKETVGPSEPFGKLTLTTEIRCVKCKHAYKLEADLTRISDGGN